MEHGQKIDSGHISNMILLNNKEKQNSVFYRKKEKLFNLV